MIKITLQEALTISEALAAFPTCPPKASYDISRFRSLIASALKPVQQQRREIIEANGGELSADGVIKWKPLPPADGEKTLRTGQAAADAEFADYLTKEIEIDREPIKLAALLDAPPDKRPQIRPELLFVLEKIIVE